MLVSATENDPLNQVKLNKIANNENSEIFQGGKSLMPLKVHLKILHENNWIYPNLTMQSGRNFPGVEVNFWTMHQVIQKPSIPSLYIQGFHIDYKIIMFTSSYF